MQNMEEEDVQDVKGRFSFQLWVVFNQGPSEVKCINKSENITPGLLYTDANKAENSFFIGSERIVGKKIQALPLLLKTTGTDNSKNA